MKMFIIQNPAAFITLLFVATVLLCVWLLKASKKNPAQTNASRIQARCMIWLHAALYLPALLIGAVRQSMQESFANSFGTGVELNGMITRAADTALATRYRLVKEGATPGATVAAISAATDKPLGILTDEAEAAGDVVNVQLLGGGGVKRMIAGETIVIGETLYVSANGRVVNTTGIGAGTFYRVGRALTGGAADSIISVETCFPVSVVNPAD